MKHKIPISLLLCSCLNILPTSAADLREGMVSYWPLDTFSADLTTTPDLVTGNHMLLNNFFDTTALVTGKRGKAIEFDGDNSQRYLYYTVAEGDNRGLPISTNKSYTIAFWVKGKGTGQNDRRMFSESSSLSTDPLVNLGTHNAGTDDTIDIFIRNSGNPINHAHSPTPGLDDAWHHLAWTYEQGAAKLYVDGKVDYTNNFTLGATPMDTTSIGAVVRASSGTPYQYFFTGLIDEVAVWERALGQVEIQDLMNNGIQTPVPAFAPTFVVQPKGVTNLMAGDSITLSAQVTGTRPLTYEWRRNNTPIAGANALSLTVGNITQAETGDYTLVVRNSVNATTSQVATLSFNLPVAPNLTNEMVAYWPLNEVQGTKTPDLVKGYDMEMENMTAADLTSGKWGQAMRFDNLRKTLLRRINRPGEDLPIYQHPSFTVSLWVNGAGNQSDRRVFSEGSTKTTQPLFNIGTHNGGADGTVDSYIRTDTGSTGDHRHSTGTAFDDTWHHIAYVQREVGGAMQASLYIDGVLDEVALNPVRPLTMDTTTIGGILRASASAWFTGMIDDVALWKRALSLEEIQKLFTEGTPTPPSQLQPLAISRFYPDLPAVAKGDPMILHWDVSKDATSITIEPGIGDVTRISTAGAGQTNLTLNNTTTFTLTIQRGSEQLSTNTTITVIDGVASNWSLLDNFDRYSVGPLSATRSWQDLRGDFAQVEDRNGNRVMSIRSTDSAAILNLRTLAVTEGQKRTLFFRMIPRGSPTAALQHILGLTDKNLRSYGDATVTEGVGPMVYPLFDTAAGAWYLGTINGVGGTIEYGVDPLQTNVVYSVWVDIENRSLTDPVNPYDTFSVYIQKEGDAGRTELFKDYTSNLNITFVDAVLGGASPDLDKLVVLGNNTAESALFDDFYLSKSGYNSTTPRSFGFTAPVGGEAPKMVISRSAGQIDITWTEGTLESSTSVPGTWSAVTGAAPPSYRITPDGAQRFYRIRR